MSLKRSALLVIALLTPMSATVLSAQYGEDVKQRMVGEAQVVVKTYQGRSTIYVGNNKLGSNVFGAINANRCGMPAGAQLSITESSDINSTAQNVAAKESLRIFVDELLAVCPDLKQVALEIRRSGRNSSNFVISPANNWTYPDSTEPRQDAMAFTDEHGLFKVDYRGPCVTEPTLLIEPVSDAARKKIFESLNLSSAEIREAAGQFALKFRGACSLVKDRVLFALDPMPKRNFCKSPEGCFITTNLDPGSYRTRTDAGAGWQYDYAFDAVSEASRFESVDDASSALAAGDVDLLFSKSDFSDFYLRTFLEAYSEQCKANIKDPVTKTYVIVRVKRYSDGFEQKVDESEPYSITIERRYVANYENGREGEVRWMMSQLMPNPLKGHGAIRAQIHMLTKTLSRNCLDDRVVTIYHNLMARTTGSPVIRGKYPSRLAAAQAMNPARQGSAQESSAPAFAKRYRQARAALEASK